jgi:hypothetical protein
MNDQIVKDTRDYFVKWRTAAKVRCRRSKACYAHRQRR